tara:strand:- start:2070 stop:2258 length:189 start_codon:yes stop_codon:yes gene_type:complete
MHINIVDKHAIQKFSAVAHNGGINLCEKFGGSFLVLRYKEDLEALRELLSQLEIIEAHGRAK